MRRRRHHGTGAALGALLALSVPQAALAGGGKGQGGPPDLSRFTPLLREDFDTLRRYDGRTGLWSTALRRRNLTTNGPCAVFLPGALKTSDGGTVALDPFATAGGTLTIRAGVIPPDVLPAVLTALADVGQDTKADCPKYYTGRISTEDSLGIRYGYFEVRAKIPAGKGHWPAFWLAPATDGWPPEIDVFEAYGRGLSRPGKRDDTFIAAVYFDALDPDGNATQAVDIVNPFATGEDGGPQTPNVQQRGRASISKFNRTFNARDYGVDIYDGFATWAMAWTPDDIRFYFGRDHDSLTEIYRTPTPADLHSDMNVILNDQITSRWGWNPIPGEEGQLFAPDNALVVDSVRIDALVPDRVVRGEGARLADGGTPSRLVGTPGDDLFALTADGSIAELSGGADTVVVARSGGTTLVSGASADDRIVLEGFYAADAADIRARLTQVGEDVWFADGVGLFLPHTVVFRGTTLSNLPEFVSRWPLTRPVFDRRDSAAKLRPAADGETVRAPAGTASRLADGGKRSVTLVGSSDGDEYEVRRATTAIVEAAGGGVDTVRAFVSYALPDNVETIVAAGDRAGLTLTGNAGDNRLEGDGGGHTFVGRGGDDLVVTGGGGGNRIVIGPHDGNDRVEGFAAADVVEIDGVSFTDFAQVAKRLVADGGDTVLSLGTGASVRLVGVAPDALTPANVAFAAGGPPAPPAATVPSIAGPRPQPRS